MSKFADENEHFLSRGYMIAKQTIKTLALNVKSCIYLSNFSQLQKKAVLV